MPDNDQIPPYEQTTVRDITPLPPGTVWPPPPRNVRRRQAFPIGTALLVTTLALVLIIGGLGFIIYSATVQYRTALHSQATVQVQSTLQAQNTVLAKTQVVAQATEQILATAQAGILASATAHANANATATAIIDAGTATATALQDMLSSKTSGTPTLNDPLSDNTGNNQWTEGITGNGNAGCIFTNAAYHAIAPQKGFLQPCFAQATNFGNFVYQVDMTIGMGSQGGILFRANSSKGQYYLFRIGTNGSYTFELYNNKQVKMFSSGVSTAINTGVGQSNTLAVIANKNVLYLYVNQQFIVSATDSTLTSGNIGVAAINYSTPTEVEFSNAQVWKL